MFHLVSILDSAFILGLIIQFTKIMDLAFREHQKQLFQRKLEELVLILEYSNPEKWFYAVFEKKKQRVILILLGIFLAFGLFVFSSLKMIRGTSIFFRILMSVLMISVTSILTILGFKYYGMKILNWITKDKFVNFFYRYLIFVLIVTIPSSLINVSYISGHVNNYFFIGFQILFGLSGLLLVWWIITVYGYVVILFRLIIFLLEILFKFIKAIVWRIVEYNKGAIAAISLIITFIIGIIDVWLQTKTN